MCVCLSVWVTLVSPDREPVLGGCGLEWPKEPSVRLYPIPLNIGLASAYHRAENRQA